VAQVRPIRRCGWLFLHNCGELPQGGGALPVQPAAAAARQ